MNGELWRLTASFPPSALADPSALDRATSVLGFEWPSDYRALLTDHNGVEGQVGTWYVVLTAVEELVEDNSYSDWSSEAIRFGGDGGEPELQREAGQRLQAALQSRAQQGGPT